MTEKTVKAPKKEKEKRQTPEERLEALRYNHMMYGPTEGELKHAQKKIDYGVTYLKHPKFQSLMTAFKKGTTFQFEVTVAGKTCTIATDGAHITFNGKTIFYSRNLNRHEDNLLLDKASMVQFQTNDALIHLAFAVLRSFQEMGTPPLSYLHKKFYWGPEALEEGAAELGSNLLVGSFKHAKVVDKPRK
jgi:hypothetical protein